MVQSYILKPGEPRLGGGSCAQGHTGTWWQAGPVHSSATVHTRLPPAPSVSFQWNQSPEFQAVSQRQQSRVPLKPRSCDVGVLPPVVEIFPFTYSQALMVFTLETMTMSLAPFHSDGR